MKYFLGLDYRAMRLNQASPALYDPETLINGHMLISGMSGTGKSFQSLRFLTSAAKSGLTIDVFDVHEELHGIDGAVAVKYSQATGYGFNPLVLDTDKHEGGPAKQINFIVSLIKSVTPQFGVNQESVLRNLLTDVYHANGIYQDNLRSWQRRSLSEAARRVIVEARRWSELREFYPTLDDLMSYAMKKLQVLKLGGDNKAATAFEQLSKQLKALHRARSNYSKQADPQELEKLEVKIEDLQNKTIEAYSLFVRCQETGREWEDLLKYESADTLAGVIRRIELLNSAGIFSANEPPFGDARVRVHQIKSLSLEQQVLFAKLRMRDIFERCKAMGPTSSGTEIRQVIFIDEAHKFFVEDGDDVINVIAKEGRKFGVAMWAASQSPLSFPREFTTNCGATVFLGLHSSFWTGVLGKFRISEATLKQIKPKEVLAIRLQREGEGDPEFINVAVPNPSSETGKQVLSWFSARSKGGAGRSNASSEQRQ